MNLNDLKEYLKAQFPDVSFFNGTINKNSKQCVGLYVVGGVKPHIAIGGLQNTTFGKLPVRILVHWTEDSNQADIQAQSIYNHLEFLTTEINNKKVSFELLDSIPIDIGRDSNNICERVIRAIITYER